MCNRYVLKRIGLQLGFRTDPNFALVLQLSLSQGQPLPLLTLFILYHIKTSFIKRIFVS